MSRAGRNDENHRLAIKALDAFAEGVEIPPALEERLWARFSLDRRLEHSMVAGEHEALKFVEAMLRARAGALFSNGRNELAAEVRDLMLSVETRRKDANSRLQKYIDASIRAAGSERAKKTRYTGHSKAPK